MHGYMMKMKAYVKNFVKDAFNDVKNGCGTEFIEEFDRVQKEFLDAANEMWENNTRRDGGRMYGGDEAEEKRKNTLYVLAYKYIMWTIILLFLFYIIGGSPAIISYIIIGFTSIANGECNGSLHFFADRFGVSHPMCRVYRDLASTLFNAFFNQDSQALLRLCVNLSQVIIAPTFGVITVNIFILATGQLLPFFNHEQRVIINDFMQSDINTMVATRNAIVNSVAHLLSNFRQTVNGTYTPTLNAPQPAN